MGRHRSPVSYTFHGARIEDGFVLYRHCETLIVRTTDMDDRPGRLPFSASMSTMLLRFRHLLLVLSGYCLLVACLFLIGYRAGRLASLTAGRTTTPSSPKRASATLTPSEFLPPDCGDPSNGHFLETDTSDDSREAEDQQMKGDPRAPAPAGHAVLDTQRIQGDRTSVSFSCSISPRREPGAPPS